jgi:hypothetical protein
MTIRDRLENPPFVDFPNRHVEVQRQESLTLIEIIDELVRTFAQGVPEDDLYPDQIAILERFVTEVGPMKWFVNGMPMNWTPHPDDSWWLECDNCGRKWPNALSAHGEKPEHIHVMFLKELEEKGKPGPTCGWIRSKKVDQAEASGG